MNIHALSTGTVRVKHSFLFPSRGRRRQLDLFTPGAFSDPRQSTAGRSSMREFCDSSTPATART
jgi:hypothetical protein